MFVYTEPTRLLVFQGSPKHGSKQQQQQQQNQLSSMLGGLDPSLLASMGLTGDLDTRMVEQVIQVCM